MTTEPDAANAEEEATRQLAMIQLSNAELIRLAKTHAPPPEWLEEDFTGLFGDDENLTPA